MDFVAELPVQPSGLVRIAFIAVVGVVYVAAVFAVRLAALRGNPPRNLRRDMSRTRLVLLTWLIITAGLAELGILRDFSMPPRLMLPVLAGFALTLWLASSRFGKHLALALPIWVLIGINAFRVPLELIMHRAAVEGLMPQQMSYTGYNFDIVTGVGALVLGFIAYRGRLPSFAIRVWNIIGLALLFNVVTIAILSMPTPFRAFHNDPPNVWVAYFPFVWLPTFLVPVALLTHLLLFRRLSEDHRQQATAATSGGEAKAGASPPG